MASNKHITRSDNDNTKNSDGLNNRGHRKSDSSKLVAFFRTGLFLLLSVVIFYPPFLRGLFFEFEQFQTEIFVFIVYIIFLFYKLLTKDKRFLETPIDYGAVGFVIVYFISLFAAVSIRLAIIEWLKYCMYFAVFIMVSELANTYRSKISLLWVIVASFLGVSAIGIDAAAGSKILVPGLNNFFAVSGISGMLGLQEMFWGLFADGRIYSTLQYPNATAACLMAVYFVTLGLIISSTKRWTKAVASACSFVILVTFILTISRGAFILMPFAALIFLVALPTGTKVKGISYSFASIIPSGFVLIKALGGSVGSISTGEIPGLWNYILIGVVLSALLGWGISFVVNLLDKIHWKIYVGIGTVAVITTLVAVTYILNSYSQLEIKHSAEENDSQLLVKKVVSLAPGKEYKLIFEVDAYNNANKPDAYTISITNKSEKEILQRTESSIVSFNGSATNGVSLKELNFKVPQDSRVVNINFINTYKDTGATFDKVRIVDADSGSMVKKLVMKYKYLPESISSRFEDIEGSRNVIERGYFYKDGLSIIKNHWLIGAGGGAWAILNFKYQSFLYWSTQAHNYFLQLGIETGVLGIAVFLFLLFSLLTMFVVERKYRYNNDVNDSIIQAALFTGVLAVFMHSFADFHLTMPAVYLLVWELIGLFVAKHKNGSDKQLIETPSQLFTKFLSKLQVVASIKPIRISAMFGLLFAVLILVLSSSMIMGIGYSREAARELSKQNYNLQSAISLIKKAADADIFHPQYKLDYANLIRSGGETYKKEFVNADKAVKEAVNLAKYNYDYFRGGERGDLLTQVGQYYLSTGNIDKGFEVLNRAAEVRPLEPSVYHAKIVANFAVINYYFSKNDNHNAMQHIDKLLAIADEAKKANARNIVPFTFGLEESETLERAKCLKDYANQKITILPGKVAFYSFLDLDIDSNGVPDQFSASPQSNVKLSYEKGRMIAENPVAGNVGYIQTRALGLQPGKVYRIEVLPGSVQAAKAIPFEIAGVSANGELKLEGKVLGAEVMIPADFKPNNNFLKLGIRGKEEIQGVRIIEK